MRPIAPHYLTGIGCFRGFIFFILATAAFSERDMKTSTILATVVFLLDVATWYVAEMIRFHGAVAHNYVWLNTLTDRFILEKLIENVRVGRAIDFNVITAEARKEALADISNDAALTAPGINGAVSNGS